MLSDELLQVMLARNAPLPVQDFLRSTSVATSEALACVVADEAELTTEISEPAD